MQENAPRAKIARSADFSRMGRWMVRRRGRGRMRMNMSRRMFVIDVAVLIFPSAYEIIGWWNLGR
jgi:uncharacterized membrane protein YjdF